MSWEGYEDKECAPHRSLGERAWCFTCSEYCYPEQPCMGCEIPRLKSALREIAAELPTKDDWRSGADFMAHVAYVLDNYSVERPEHYRKEGEIGSDFRSV